MRDLFLSSLDQRNGSGWSASLSRTRGGWLRHLRHWGIRRGRLLQQLPLLQRGDQGVARDCTHERQKVEYISKGPVTGPSLFEYNSCSFIYIKRIYV